MILNLRTELNSPPF